MKKTVLLVGAVVLMGGLAFADGPATPPMGGGSKSPGPCQQIMQACKGAGFVRGQAKEGKGLFKDCFQPVLAGQAVQGVTVDPSVVQACQQKRASHKGGKGGQGGQGQGTQEPAGQ